MALGTAVTIAGYGGSVQTLYYQTLILPYLTYYAPFGESVYQAAGQAAFGISGLVQAGGATISAYDTASTIAPSVTSSAIGYNYLQASGAGQFSVINGYAGLIDIATVPTTIIGSKSGFDQILTGSSDITYYASFGTERLYAGDGNNNIYVGALGYSYGNSIFIGDGNNTVILKSGNNSVSSGLGNNLIFASGGNDTIASSGNDLIVCQDGNATVQLNAYRGTASARIRTVYLGTGSSQIVEDSSQNSALVGAQAPQSVIVVGSSAATVNAQFPDQIWMQAGGGIINSTGVSVPALGLFQDLPAGGTVGASIGGSVLAVTLAAVTLSTIFPGFPGVAQPTLVSDTIIGGTGAVTVNTTLASDFIFAGTGALQFNGGTGASTILGNTSGSATINGGAGSVVAIAYGQTRFTGGSGAATVAAFGSGVTINGGSGTGLFVGASVGGNLISGGSGSAIIYGGGTGDVLTAGAAGGIIVAGAGSETLIGGAGADLFAAIAGKSANLVVQNFTQGQDSFTLLGFGAGEAATALAGAVTIAGSQQLTLSDGTKILFSGVTGLGASSFI